MRTTANEDRRRWAAAWVLGGAALVTLVALALVPSGRAGPASYRFADERGFLGVPNFLDVASNLPFLLAGLEGLRLAARRRLRRGGAPWLVSLGLVATALGSAHYHLEPGLHRLLWDRLPIALVFMAAFALVLELTIAPRLARRLLPWLVVVGAATVIHWYLGERSGDGDLRPYVVVQLYPMLVLPALAVVAPPRRGRRDLVAAVGLYALAKLFEVGDAAVFAVGEVVSGHTMKHLFAGWASFHLVRLARADERNGDAARSPAPS